MTVTEQLREWCAEKGSPWFTRKDLVRVTGLDYDYSETWLKMEEVTGGIAHKKGSSWYKLCPETTAVNYGPNVVGTGKLDAKTRQRLEGHLAMKWEMEDKLSADHPYKLGVV